MRDFGLTLLNSVPAHIAVLDRAGKILAVNDAWLDFARTNGSGQLDALAVGASYLEACRAAGTDPWAAQALRGIEAVLHGQRARFTLEYPCHSPTEQRWFLMTVARATKDVQGVVVAHVDITEQKRGEQALRESEAQFRAMFSVASFGKAQADPATGRLLRVNAALCRMTGYSEAELLARTVRDLTHPDDREEDWARFSRMSAGEGSGYENEKRYIRADGQVIGVYVSANLIRDAAGRPMRTTAVIQDITERKREQAALQRSSDRLELLSRSVSTLLTAPDPQAVVERLCNDVRRFLDCDLFFNYLLDRGAQRLRLNACGGVAPRLARKVEDLELGASFCGSAARDACRLLAENLAASADPRGALVRSLGVRAYACHPLLGAKNEVIGTLSFGTRSRDTFSAEDLELMKTVTDHVAVAILRRRIEQALRESEERLRSVLNATGVGLWLDQIPLGRLNWDARTRELFFFRPDEEPTMELFWSRLHPDDREPTRLAIEQALRDRTLYAIDYRAVDPATGRVRWIHSQGRSIDDAQSQPIHFDGITYDITERKEFQAELERAVAERTASLKELVGELEHFSYTITHDMRAPLRAMRGFAEVVDELCAKCPGGEQRMFLGRIITAAERMDALITDALNYSKAVRNELPLAPVDLARLLRGMLDTYPEFQGAQVAIEVERELPLVMGNEAALTQCFSNLLDNAVKFVEPARKAQVRVRSESREDWVRLWVEDNGIGISAAMLPRIFDMFSRGSSPQAGTGIGLALVRKVVERMGGKVGVESEPGKGSRFWVDLRPGNVRPGLPMPQPAPPAAAGGS